MLENEPQIIRQAQDGNPEYFGLLYDHYLTPIYRFVFLKIGRRDETQDLVHEVFLSAWKNIDDFDQRGFPFSSWLYRIARNKVIDYYRTRKPSTTLDEVDEERIKLMPAIEKQIDADIDFKLIQGAIRQLNEEQQTVVLMRFVEEISYPEIAAFLEKSEGAVRLIQHRAIQNLKKIIARNDHVV